MVEVKSRPQTTYYVGSENYSGMKIPWTVMSVPVRVRPAVQTLNNNQHEQNQKIL